MCVSALDTLRPHHHRLVKPRPLIFSNTSVSSSRGARETFHLCWYLVVPSRPRVGPPHRLVQTTDVDAVVSAPSSAGRDTATPSSPSRWSGCEGEVGP